MPNAPGPNVPFPPQEAELVDDIPTGPKWQYEPKWDGFRGVLENDGGELALWSRNERPLLRYFPELRPLGDLLPPHSALDGEIVIAREGVLDFDSMQMRLHPAESRINRLAGEIPAELVVEVRYDKVQGNRFRHGTKFLRWRDDKDPHDCTWRELRPPRDPSAPTVEALLAS